VRGVLEGMAARLVAERTLKDVDRDVLQSCVHQGQALLVQAADNNFVLDSQGWTAMNARFHATLIAAADNKVLANAIREIGQMPLVGAQALSLHGIAPQREYAFIQRAQLDHEDVLSAILAGESARAEALMREAEQMAADCGKTLLVLDTVTGSTAHRLYMRLGWQRVGEVPDFALWPRGGLCPTTFFYKRVGG
jgi:GntR family transcriptional regulator of vanillate catabolism